MSFDDILYEVIVSSANATDIGLYDIILSFGIALIMSIYIFFIYRVLGRKNFYNKSFNISLAVITILTNAIVIAIQSSIIVSLGMVGALSIVRFRTAVKDALDLVFMFWAIATGILCGVGLFHVAGLVLLIVTVLIFVLDMMPIAKAPMILVVQSLDFNVQKDIYSIVQANSRYCKIKSRNVDDKHLNLVMELRTDKDEQLLGQIHALEGIEYVSLLDHDGEVTY